VEFDSILRISSEAEKLDYSTIWANEHLTLPVEALPKETKFLEPLVLLAALSGHTSKILLGSAIVILPVRDPFVTAKQIATMAVVTRGRFIFGVGVGRFEREYLSHGKEWKKRGEILDEQLFILQELLAGKLLSFNGKYYRSNNFSIWPVPQGSRKIPIVLGGVAKVALRRASKYCDGIMPGHVTPEEIREISEYMKDELAKNGRSPSEVKLYAESIISLADKESDAKSKFASSTYVKKITYATDLKKKALIGAPESIKKRLKEYEEAGVQELVLVFADESLNGLLDSMRIFANEVMPAFR
jgi:probable F420-dependent oxidoreductase